MWNWKEGWARWRSPPPPSGQVIAPPPVLKEMPRLYSEPVDRWPSRALLPSRRLRWDTSLRNKRTHLGSASPIGAVRVRGCGEEAKAMQLSDSLRGRGAGDAQWCKILRGVSEGLAFPPTLVSQSTVVFFQEALGACQTPVHYAFLGQYDWFEHPWYIHC